MGEILQLDYYYGIEAEQFSFYRVPRLLIKDDNFKALPITIVPLHENEECGGYCTDGGTEILGYVCQVPVS